MIRKINIILLTLFIQLVICEEAVISNKNDNVIPDNEKQELAKTINNFGYKILMAMLKEDSIENVVLSPVSITGLLAMTLLGTVGKTYQELAVALGFSQDVVENRKYHDTFGELLQSLNSNYSNISKTLYANAIFIDEQARLREIYRNYLSYVYKSELHSVNFSKSVEVKEKINDWVSAHTIDKIKNFLEKPLPLETKAVLLSALYFNGQWEHPFLLQHTMSLPFHTPQKDVMVDQMLNMGQFDYIFSEEYDMHMIALPYNDSTTTMYAMKPFDHKQQSLNTLLNRLDHDKIDQLIDQMTKSKCVIRFPKMDIRSNAKLEKALKSLGLRSIFEPREANFALMVDDKKSANKTEDEILARIDNGSEVYVQEILNSLPNPGIYVDSVLHDVRLTINEFGTEAVAASASVLARTAKLFYGNSPFYIFIRNEKTKLVTFNAAIFDPSA